MLVIKASGIYDWESFHDVFKEAFGFPDFYGRNMSAFIDCLTYLDEPETGMTRFIVSPGEVFVLTLIGADDLKARLPDVFIALVESLDFVNKRRIEVGEPAVISLNLD